VEQVEDGSSKLRFREALIRSKYILPPDNRTNR
jgi:hypothetical protein